MGVAAEPKHSGEIPASLSEVKRSNKSTIVIPFRFTGVCSGEGLD